MARLRIVIDGTSYSLDRDDVVAWAGEHLDVGDEPASELEAIRRSATAYIRANPRPEPDAQGGVNVPARQRMALLRRLAAGPATRRELLAAMRSAAGYVGGDDWRNRSDELRGRGKRGGGHTPLPLVEEDGRYRLTESFASLTARDRQLLGRVKRLVLEADADPAISVVLDALFPEVGVEPPALTSDEP